jgi:predicted phage-related endonuclease
MERFKFEESNFTVTDVSGFSHDEWLDFRLKGIGCSEVGSIMGVNKWSHAAHVFSQKVGETGLKIEDNMPMHMGRLMEPVVMDMWQFWDPDTGSLDSYLENSANGEIVRECYKPDIYLQNNKYPWLIGGCDALFEHEGKVAILEVKTISSYSADQYEGGIPPSYIFQIQAYMALHDAEYAEIVMLKDGRDIEVFPFERNDTIIDAMVEKCSDFWDKVTLAKGYIGSGEKDKAFTEFYPEADDTTSYQEFVKDRFKDGGREGGISSTDEIDASVERYLDLSEKEKELKALKLKESNIIKSFMGDYEDINFAHTDYKVSWRKGKGARRLLIKDKS